MKIKYEYKKNWCFKNIDKKNRLKIINIEKYNKKRFIKVLMERKMEKKRLNKENRRRDVMKGWEERLKDGWKDEWK